MLLQFMCLGNFWTSLHCWVTAKRLVSGCWQSWSPWKCFCSDNVHTAFQTMVNICSVTGFPHWLFLSRMWVWWHSINRVFYFRNFPDYYYKLQFTIPGTSSNIDILMLDTVVMCGNSLDDRLGLQPMGPMSVSEAEKQWQWVEENINSSR